MVVADWSYLRARQFNELSNRAAWMVPETVFREVTGSKDPERSVRKLRRAVVANRDRLLIGRYWNEIAVKETAADALSEVDDLVHPEMTLVLRALADQSEELWLEGLAERLHEGPDPEYEERRRFLEDACNGFAAWVALHAPDLVKMQGSPETQREWIRFPDHPVEWAAQGTPSLDTPEWRAALAVFPDRLAAGRWGRCLVWSCMRRAIGVKRGLDNDWDDAHYAFLASYTGHLATQDRGLAEMVEAIYPNVMVRSHPTG